MEGPSEFAEGLAIGVRSVFSGVVGGAAGTVSKITGALGKGLASLTFDEKFQQVIPGSDWSIVLMLASVWSRVSSSHWLEINWPLFGQSFKTFFSLVGLHCNTGL